MTNSSRKTLARLNRAALMMILPVAVACGTEGNPSPFEPTEPVGRVRLVNLIRNAPDTVVNASLAGVVFTAGLRPGQAAPANLPAPATATYSPVYAGNREFLLKRTSDTAVVVATLPFTIAGNEDKTVYAVGGATGSAVAGVVTTDDNPAPVAGETRLRIANMTSSAVDVFVTAAGADLAAATPRAAGLASRTASSYFTVTPGSYVVRLVPAGTAPANRAAAVTFTSGATAFASATGRTILLADPASGATALRSFILTDR